MTHTLWLFKGTQPLYHWKNYITRELPARDEPQFLAYQGSSVLYRLNLSGLHLLSFQNSSHIPSYLGIRGRATFHPFLVLE